MKVGIIYGSTMGNTQNMSEKISGVFAEAGHEVILKNVRDMPPKAMLEFDVAILGCSTWGDGDLQDDFIEFEKRMREVDLAGKKAAVFGPGDSAYPNFCRAIDILEKGLAGCGAELVSASLKIDGDVDIQMDKTIEWAESIAQRI